MNPKPHPAPRGSLAESLGLHVAFEGGKRATGKRVLAEPGPSAQPSLAEVSCQREAGEQSSKSPSAAVHTAQGASGDTKGDCTVCVPELPHTNMGGQSPEARLALGQLLVGHWLPSPTRSARTRLTPPVVLCA